MQPTLSSCCRAAAQFNDVIQCTGQSDLTAVRQAIQSGLNGGVDLVNYIGHGAIDRLGGSGHLTSADVALDNPTTAPAIYNLIGDPALYYNVATQPALTGPAPRFTSVTASNGVLVITWTGGAPPYQLETRASLEPGASWQSLGSPVNGLSATVPMSGPAGFIRLRCGR